MSQGPRKIGRRSFMAAGAAAASALAMGAEVTVASGSPLASPARSTNGPGRNGVSAARPKRGGHLTIGTDAEEQGLSPTGTEWAENGYAYGKALFDPLVAVGADGLAVPYLAQSVEPANEDHSSWIITMRPNVSFHDGTACDARAIYSNIEHAETSIETKGIFTHFIKGASVTSPTKLRIDLQTSMVTFPYYLSRQIGYIAAPSMIKTATGSPPVGTGPFAYTSWIPNTHLTATRNPHYWRKGFPYLTSITFKPIVNPASMAEALTRGTVDLISTSTAATIKSYRGTKEWSYVDTTGQTVGEPTVSCIQLNCGAPPFNDHVARLALAKACTQSALVRIFGLGISEPVTSPFARGTPYHQKTSYPHHDPAGARAAVRDYERRHAKKLAFTLTYVPQPSLQRVALYLKQRYEDVGMQVTLATSLQNKLIDDAVGGAYQAVTWRQFGTIDPDLNYVFWSDTTVKDTGLSLNIARNKDPRIEKALVEGRSAATSSARVAAYRAVGEYLAQDLPYIWLGTVVWALIANPKVQNFANPLGPGGTGLMGPTSSIWPTQVWIS